MADRPKISVLMPTRNRSEQLQKAINSILNQTEQNFELIIVDDSSTDRSKEILEGLARTHEKIKLVFNNDHQGFCYARKQASEVARGEYLAIMDDDAIAHPERLATQREYLDKNPEIGLVSSSFDHLNQDHHVISQEPSDEMIEQFPSEPDDAFEYLYVTRNVIANFSVMMRRQALELVDGYSDQNYNGYDDKYLWLKMASKGVRFHILKTPLVSHVDIKENRQGLLDNREHVFKSKHYVLNAIQRWLKREGITHYNHLHRRANASVIAKESRYRGGWKGLWLLIKAWLCDAQNKQVRQTVAFYQGKLKK